MARFQVLVLCGLLGMSSLCRAEHGEAAVGSLAPDFHARNILTGERIELGSQRGKIVIVTFWATWCPPCRRELPILERAQEVIGKDKLTVFAVSHHDDEAAATLRKVAKNWQINLLADPTDYIAVRYGVRAIPHLFMIGRDGRIIASHTGYGDRSVEALVDDLNRALAAPVDDGGKSEPSL